MNLSNLKPGQIAIVDRIVNDKDEQALSQRLEAMGIVSDRPVQILREAKLGGPLQIRVGATTEIAIRPEEAQMILIKTDETSQDAEVSPNTTPELSNQVKTASFVSITAIILVAIAGFYRVVVTRNINPVDAENLANNPTNVVYDSNSKLTLEEKTQTTDTNKTVPEVAKNPDAVNKESDLEKTSIATNETPITAPTTNQNTNLSVGGTTNYKPKNIESTTKKISDNTTILELKEKLYNTIDRSWTIPIDRTSIYLVKVGRDGAIATYEPFNQVASDNMKNTPLPSLVNSDNTTKTETLKTEWAEFAVLFYEDGVLEVQAK
ncbi:MAG: FeoA domain-containing protein [Microcoleaceae cyanobacterium]